MVNAVKHPIILPFTLANTIPTSSIRHFGISAKVGTVGAPPLSSVQLPRTYSVAPPFWSSLPVDMQMLLLRQA
jgi:hypothetical protein